MANEIQELKFQVGEAWKGVYSSSTAYGLANVVQDHTGLSVYRSLKSGNVGHPLSDASWWFRIIDMSSIKAESDRIAALNQTIAQDEALRVAAEELRQQHEAARIAAETQRDEAEQARISAEQGRVNAEIARATAEQQRITAEQGRVSAESARVQAEQARVLSETLRANAEDQRAANEQNRIAAEQQRIERAEQDHDRAESDHATYVDSLGAFDISSYHATGGVLAKYADLAAALGTDGANIPADLRKGGMSVKFVQSSDNKYVQYRLMSDSFNTTPTNWQGVDEEPTAGSDSLVRSGGVYDMNIITLLEISSQIAYNSSTQQKNYLILRDNSGKFGTASSRKHRCYPVNIGEKYIISNTSQDSTLSVLWAFVTTSDATSGGDIPFVSGTGLSEVQIGKSVVVTIPEGCTHIICSYGEEAAGYAYGLLYKVDVKEWSKFASGESVGNVSIADEISSENEGLAKSGDVYNALEELNKSKVDIKIGKNLLDSSVYTSEYIDEDGSLVSSNIYKTSTFISVLPETVYYASAENDATIYDYRLHYIAFYDENKSLISTLENTKSFTTPVGCYYLRLCWYYKKSELMLNQGSERGNYEEYSEIGGYPYKNEERIENIESSLSSIATDVEDINPKVADLTNDIATIENELRTVEENISDIENDIYEDVEVDAINEGSSDIDATGDYYYSDGYRTIKLSDGTIASGNSRYVTCFVEIKEGLKINVYLPNDTNKASYALYNYEKEFVSAYRVEATGVVTVLPTQGVKYIRWCGYTSQVSRYKRFTKVPVTDALDERITQNTEDIEEIKHQIVYKDGAIIAKADDLTADLSLADSSSSVQDGFPYSNKYGDKYSFGCRVTSFSGIKICRGYAADYAKWFEIDGTNIVLKSGENGTPSGSVAHGLTIEGMLNVNININSSGVARVVMQTLDGDFVHDFTGWGRGASGVLHVKNNGSVLTNCILSATNNYINSNIWVFGASFESISQSRWTGQIIDVMGYSNFLINGYPGRNGATALKDFKRALNLGTPQYLFFPSSNDGSLTVYKNNIEAVLQICQDNNITLVVGRKADNNSTNFSEYRTYIDEVLIPQGVRCVDYYLALHDPDKVWELGDAAWYDGFMSSDGTHPSTNGAKALAQQFCLDFPEIMQFAEDRVVGVSGNFVGFNTNGYMADSGSKPSDFMSA